MKQELKWNPKLKCVKILTFSKKNIKILHLLYISPGSRPIFPLSGNNLQCNVDLNHFFPKIGTMYIWQLYRVCWPGGERVGPFYCFLLRLGPFCVIHSPRIAAAAAWSVCFHRNKILISKANCWVNPKIEAAETRQANNTTQGWEIVDQ